MERDPLSAELRKRWMDLIDETFPLAKPKPTGDGSRGSVANTLSVVQEMVEAGDPTSPGDGIDAPPATSAVLTDEELRAIYDAEEYEAPDEFTIEDGLRAVARAQHAKSGVVVRMSSIDAMCDTMYDKHDAGVVAAWLRSIGVTVEDQQ